MKDALPKLTIAGIALGIICTQAYERGYIDGDIFGRAQANAPAITIDKLTALSVKYNARLPMMMDKETRWDTSSAGPGLELKYYYTVVNYRADQINSSQIKQYQWQVTKEKVCSARELKTFWKNGVTLKYNYKGKDGRYVMDFAVTPEQCGY